MVVSAKVVKILGKSGAKGIYRVRCAVQAEGGRSKVIVRNVLGPIKVGDIIVLTEADMETAETIE